MKKFAPDLTVFVCPHVFAKERPILDVIRDFDGTWQFLCGHDFADPDSAPEDGSSHQPDGGPQKIAVRQLLEREPTLAQMAALEEGHFAERESETTKWLFGELE